MTLSLSESTGPRPRASVFRAAEVDAAYPVRGGRYVEARSRVIHHTEGFLVEGKRFIARTGLSILILAVAVSFAAVVSAISIAAVATWVVLR